MNASQTVIIILLMANLAATTWFGLEEKPVEAMTQTEKVAIHELPPAVSSEVRDYLYAEFARAFNAEDYDALYDMFGPSAKAQITKESAEKEFEKLTKFFHSVESGGFNHSELAGSQGNTNFYTLNYLVKLPKSSEFGTKGILKITVAIQGGDYQVYGIRLNAG